MRVIFDLSSLHGENFDSVRASPVIDLVRRGKLTIWHTPTFLEEILHGSLSVRHAERWPDVLRWALDIQPSGFFLDKLDIWHEELVVGAGPQARRTYQKNRTRRYMSHAELVARLTHLADAGEIDNVLDSSVMAQIDSDHQKKNAQKKLGQEIRQSVAEKAKRAGGLKHLDEMPFWRVRDRGVHTWGMELASFLGPDQEARVRNSWTANQPRSPFYTAFAEGIAFWAYQAACKKSRFDRNAQLDFEQLCYLTWADIIVSNDTGFMRSAFDELWRPRGKRLMTTNQFLNLVAAIH